MKVGLNLSKTTLILSKADMVTRLATNEGLMQMVRELCTHRRGSLRRRGLSTWKRCRRNGTL